MRPDRRGHLSSKGAPVVTAPTGTPFEEKRQKVLPSDCLWEIGKGAPVAGVPKKVPT